MHLRSHIIISEFTWIHAGVATVIGSFVHLSNHERRSQAFQLIERVLLEAAAFPQVAIETDDVGAVKELVRGGLGVAVVPSWTVKAERASGTLAVLGVGKHGLWRTLGLALSEQDHQSVALKAFVRLCAERLPGLLAA